MKPTCESVSINANLKESLDSLSGIYAENKPAESDDYKIIIEPFKCVDLSNFITNDQFLHQVKEEFCDLDLVPKNNDLYKFAQSVDLKKIKSDKISELVKLFSNEILPFMRQLTQLPLNDTIDLTVSKYGYTGKMLFL